MKSSKEFYDELFSLIGDLTPLSSNCGSLCGSACCKGDEDIGIRLFPNEETPLKRKAFLEGTLAVCSGSCDRLSRPLACRIFPFFPSLSKDGKIEVKLDARALRICPLVENSSEIRFDKDFIRAVRRVGRRLSKDAKCREFLLENGKEIEQYEKLFGIKPTYSKRK